MKNTDFRYKEGIAVHGGGAVLNIFRLYARAIMDLFNNPVDYRTSLAKCSAFCCFLSVSCSETEVSEQLYYKELKK
ncbi:MAG: hypothetical protein LBF75_06450 [Treponema sp.]|nr:hypothetical protein [Treponema sp.]